MCARTICQGLETSLAKDKLNVYAQQQSINKKMYIAKWKKKGKTGWVAWYGFAMELALMSPAFLFGASTSLPLAEEATCRVVCLREIVKAQPNSQCSQSMHWQAAALPPQPRSAPPCCPLNLTCLRSPIGQSNAEKTHTITIFF